MLDIFFFSFFAMLHDTPLRRYIRDIRHDVYCHDTHFITPRLTSHTTPSSINVARHHIRRHTIAAFALTIHLRFTFSSFFTIFFPSRHRPVFHHLRRSPMPSAVINHLFRLPSSFPADADFASIISLMPDSARRLCRCCAGRHAASLSATRVAY